MSGKLDGCGEVPLNLDTLKAASHEELEAAILLAMHDEAFFNYGHWRGDTGEVKLLLICNDTFAYGGADCEHVPFSEAPKLLEIYDREGHYGLIRWIAERRGERPIGPVKKAMEEDQKARKP